MSGSHDDFSVVEKRLYATLLPSGTNVNSIYLAAKKYSESMKENGQWDDIDYKDQNQVTWKTTAHLRPRLIDMATAYVTPGQPLHADVTLLAHINAALKFWLDKDFHNPNWWWNMISVPTSIGQISLLLKDHLSSAEKAGCVKIMAKADWKGYTGANLVWMANVHVYSGFVTNSQDYVKQAFDRIYGEITVTPSAEDGIKQDGSFYQHARELYNGGYGADFTSIILSYLKITVGTSFFIGADNLATFGLLVLDGDQWMTFGNTWDYSVKGREITRPNPLTNTFDPAILRSISGPRHKEFEAFADRLQGKAPSFDGNTHYWKGDYMVHRRKTFGATVKMYSTRMHNAECVNGEGLKSIHLSDGVFNLYQTGKEFELIYPTWDWERIPGITCALGEVPLSTPAKEMRVLGKTDFVGGVSDGKYGAAAYDFAAALHGKLTAKKAWFFFDNEIVALGGEITGGSGFPIKTSINQCLLNGDVYVSNSTTPLPSGNHSFDKNIQWVYHDGIGYVFPAAKSLGLSNQQQHGSWQEIGAAHGAVTKEVFNFWINQHDGGDTYEYFVIPSIKWSDLEKIATETLHNVLTLQNDGNIQAVYHTELQILQAAFYKAGSIIVKGKMNVSVNSPCIIMIEFTQTDITTYVADPTHRLTELTVTLGASLKQGGHAAGTAPAATHDGSKSTSLNFKLPIGEFAGHTTSIRSTLA